MMKRTGVRRFNPAVIIFSAVLAGCSKSPDPPTPTVANSAPVPASAAQDSAVTTGPLAAPAPPINPAATSAPAPQSEPTQPVAAVRSDAHSASLEKQALMVALLPDWKSGMDHDARAVIGSSPSSAPTANEDKADNPLSQAADHIHVALQTGDADLYPEPWAVVRLDDVHAVLITEATGASEPAGGSDEIVGAYFFTNSDGVWHLSKSVDVLTSEYNNESSELKSEPWPDHGVVLSLLTESGNQGQFARHVDMTLLRPDSATPILKASVSERDGGVLYDETRALFDAGTTCEDYLSENFKMPLHDKLQTGTQCHSATGSWRFDGNLVRFDYEGKTRTVNEAGTVAPLQRWKSTATYRWDNGSVKLVAGKDPEFGY